MSDIVLDERLQFDCHELGSLALCKVLLNRNAGVSWCILVPRTEHKEIVDMPLEQQQLLLLEVNKVAAFVRKVFEVDKLNIAAIGNIVSQLHVHVIGRREGDYCWPDVVWGTSNDATYSERQVQELRRLFGQVPAA